MDNNKQKETTLDDLAIMVAKGFDDITAKFDDATSKMATKDDISRLEAEMSELKQQMAALTSSVNNYLALSDKRYLELKARQNLIVSWVKKIADKTGVEINLEELEKIG